MKISVLEWDCSGSDNYNIQYLNVFGGATYCNSSLYNSVLAVTCELYCMHSTVHTLCVCTVGESASVDYTVC